MAQAQHAHAESERTADLTTPFDNPIKIQLQTSTKARRYFMRECEVYEGDNGHGDLHTACRDAVNTARQKTNMVFKTPREALSDGNVLTSFSCLECGETLGTENMAVLLAQSRMVRHEEYSTYSGGWCITGWHQDCQTGVLETLETVWDHTDDSLPNEL